MSSSPGEKCTVHSGLRRSGKSRLQPFSPVAYAYVCCQISQNHKEDRESFGLRIEILLRYLIGSYSSGLPVYIIGLFT